MSTRVHDATDRDRFEIRVDGQLAGFLQYQRARNLLVIEHTEVASAHQGQGYAAELVVAALDQARREHRRVIVVCPFAKSWIGRHPDYADLDYAHHAGDGTIAGRGRDHGPRT